MTSLETNTAGSSKPITLPPRDYIHVLSKRYFYFFFICLISTKRFVCTHSYIILHYILLRQTGRWAIFALSRREAVAVASRTCILHKPAQDDHFLRRVKTDSSAAQRLSLDRNEERYICKRITSYTHPDSGGRKIPDLRHLHRNCVNTTSTDRHLHLAHYLSTIISYLLALCIVYARWRRIHHHA